MSSATAAPRTVRASMLASARRSPKTRAVMPTLVAVSAAPTKTASLPSNPSPSPAKMPVTIGTTTPTIATAMDARPTDLSSRRSISMPTSSSRRMTPSSASVRMTSFGSTKPKTDGPMSTPAKISATTAGMLMRSAISAAIFAATSTTRMSTSTELTSTGCAPSGSLECASDFAQCRGAGTTRPHASLTLLPDAHPTRPHHTGEEDGPAGARVREDAGRSTRYMTGVPSLV